MRGYPHWQPEGCNTPHPYFSLFLYLCKHTSTFVVTIFCRFVVSRTDGLTTRLRALPWSSFRVVRAGCLFVTYQVWPRLVSLVFRLMVGECCLIRAESSVSDRGGHLASRIWRYFAKRRDESRHPLHYIPWVSRLKLVQLLSFLSSMQSYLSSCF